MYKNLKFSWAHVLMFIALIGIGYVTYVGLTYKMDNGLLQPLFYTLCILLILFFWFFGAQQLKGVDNNFNFSRCIWIERFLIFTSPIVFVLCLIPYNHALNVASKSSEIETGFKNAITLSTKMFDDYDIYVNGRVDRYDGFLNRVCENKYIQPDVYKNVGFTGEDDAREIEIEVEILKRQLTAKYDSLQVEAKAWIEHASLNTSVWNVFLVGNIKEISVAITEWNNQLEGFSSKIMTGERYYNAKPFHTVSMSFNRTLSQLNSLSSIYTADYGVSWVSVVSGVFLYLMMVLPYIVQTRNGVSVYTLLGRKNIEVGIGSIETPKSGRNKSVIETAPINMDDSATETIHMSQTGSAEESDILMSPLLDDEDDCERDLRRRQRRRRRSENANNASRSQHRDIEIDDDEDATINVINNI